MRIEKGKLVQTGYLLREFILLILCVGSESEFPYKTATCKVCYNCYYNKKYCLNVICKIKNQLNVKINLIKSFPIGCKGSSL